VGTEFIGRRLCIPGKASIETQAGDTDNNHHHLPEDHYDCKPRGYQVAYKQQFVSTLIAEGVLWRTGIE
jgi:hypothetical protein